MRKQAGEKKEKEYSVVKNILFANQLIFRSSPALYLTYFILNCLTVGSSYVSLKIGERTLNTLYSVFTEKPERIFDKIYPFLLLAALSLVLYGVGVVKTFVRNKIDFNFTQQYQKKFGGKLCRIQWEHFEENKKNLKIHETVNNAYNAIFFCFDALNFFAYAVVLFLYLSTELFQINLLIVIIYLALLVISNLYSMRFTKKLNTIWSEIQPATQKSAYYFKMCGDKITHQEYRFHQLFPFVSGRWERYFGEEYHLRMKLYRKYEIILQVCRIVVNLPFILMLLWVSAEIAQGRHEIGFFLLTKNMLNQIVNLFGTIRYYADQSIPKTKFVQSYIDVMNFSEDPPVLPAPHLQKEICLTNISYVYPQSDFKALDQLNLTIHKGDKIAIVGHNGSGKTTFTNVLNMLTTNFEGQITFDGSPDAYSPLRQNIAILNQNFLQYQMTVRENIVLNQEDQALTDEYLYQILDKVGLKEYIESLPDGIHTMLGQLDKGTDLSKGQWQKIAIARLLVNRNADIWILDEPTAYLDPLAEIDIYNLIYSLAENKTVLFISHRLGFAQRADKILVFDKGRIAEEGTHEELLAKEGVYSQMFEAQKSWYQESADVSA